MRISIGMAVHTDPEGIWWTIQCLRLMHDLTDVEIIIVDNAPKTNAAKIIQNYVGQWLLSQTADMGRSPNPSIAAVKYVPFDEITGTAAPRNKVFEVATGEVVVCIDSHVILMPGALQALRDFYRQNPECKDLLTGPMMYDDYRQHSTHMNDVFRGEMRGIWGMAWASPDGEMISVMPRAVRVDDKNIRTQGLVIGLMSQAPASHVPDWMRQPIAWEGHEARLMAEGFAPAVERDRPFEIPAMGLGLFACRKVAWLGFHNDFRGFGGEEYYIHEKYRRAGHACLSLPRLKWLHRFVRSGISYPLTTWHKCRNYVIGHRDLGLPLDRVERHFVQGLNEDGSPWGNGKLEHKTISQEYWKLILDGGVDEPKTNCSSCGGTLPSTLAEWYDKAVKTPSDINEHVPTLRDLAEEAEIVVEFGVRHGTSSVGLLQGLAAKKAEMFGKMVSYDVNRSMEAKHLQELAAKNNVEFEFVQGDSRQAEIPDCDLLFIDTVHTAEHVYAELIQSHAKVRRKIAFHDTQIYGENGERGGPGILVGIRRFLKEFPQWSVVDHYENNNGFTVISRDPRDKPSLPSLPRMAWNYARALAVHVASGQKAASEPTINLRLDTCLGCSQRVDNRCTKCGCYLDVDDKGKPGKATWLDGECPFGFWAEAEQKGHPVMPLIKLNVKK